MKLNNILADYSTKPNVSISKQHDATLVTVKMTRHFAIEITVPETVLEWSVALKDSETGRELLSDWMDHYSLDDETQEQLESERTEEIIQFLNVIVDSNIRLTELKRRRWFFWSKVAPILEVQTASGWQKILPF